MEAAGKALSFVERPLDEPNRAGNTAVIEGMDAAMASPTLRLPGMRFRIKETRNPDSQSETLPHVPKLTAGRADPWPQYKDGSEP